MGARMAGPLGCIFDPWKDALPPLKTSDNVVVSCMGSRCDTQWPRLQSEIETESETESKALPSHSLSALGLGSTHDYLTPVLELSGPSSQVMSWANGDCTCLTR